MQDLEDALETKKFKNDPSPVYSAKLMSGRSKVDEPENPLNILASV
jgi:hypothetical protein